MGCTTLMVGRKATNDGSTLVARNEDCGDGDFEPKKMVVIEPDQQPRTYTGVYSHLTIELPDNPLRYTCTPTADQSNGNWYEAGINAANVTMSATETISSNARVLGADPLVMYQPQVGNPGDANYSPEVAAGIGEENLVTIILPYIKSAKEGVLRMGQLLEEYGTYEMNGVIFSDAKDIWYIETIGGHHWIARRVPDDCYVPQPNRQGIDFFDFYDAFGDGNDYLCSADLPKWMLENNLFVSMTPDTLMSFDGVQVPRTFNPRECFSSYTWLDIVYNNPRAWYMFKMFNMDNDDFNGATPKYGSESMDMPWCMKPKVKLSVMDVKNMLSSTYDGTIYDPYGLQGTEESRKRFREIGINRTSECSILQVRPYVPAAIAAVQWVAFASNPFNTAIAMYTNVKNIPAYLDTDHSKVSTDSFYWMARLVGGLADADYFDNMEAISGYQQVTLAQGYTSLFETDALLKKYAAEGKVDLDNMEDETVINELEKANSKLVDFVKSQNDQLLFTVLFNRSLKMKNAFGASDH